MPQLSIRGPAAERDAQGEGRLHPVGPLARPRHRAERAGPGLQRVQTLPDPSNRRIAEPGDGVPDIAEVPILIWNAKQQAAEKRPRSPWFGPPANDARQLMEVRRALDGSSHVATRRACVSRARPSSSSSASRRSCVRRECWRPGATGAAAPSDRRPPLTAARPPRAGRRSCLSSSP